MTAPLQGVFDELASQTGLPADHLRTAFSIILTYPYALIYNRLPDNPTIKHIYSIVITTLTMCWFHQLWNGFAQLFLSALFVYVFMRFNQGNKMAPRIVFVVEMLHMSYSHIIRQRKGYLGDEDFDHTGPQMVMLMKLTSFAFNVYDGQQDPSHLTEYNKQKMIRKFPSLLEYFGWVFFFGGFLVGPAFEYADYRNFTDMSVFRQAPPGKSKKMETENGSTSEELPVLKPPLAIPALKSIGMSALWLVALVTISPRFTPFDMLEPKFAEQPLWYRLLWVQMASFGVRVKYYVVWTLAEGACQLCGLGFNGYEKNTGKALWNRVSNIDPVAYERAENCKVLLESWNQRTNVWLRNYVYLRVAKRGKKPGFKSTLATFVTSAFWHGFHPGYYLTFVSGALIQNMAKKLRRNLRPLVFTPDLKHALPVKHFYDFYGWVATQSCFNYIVLPFVLLNLRDSLTAWKAVYFYGHVATFAAEIFFMAGGAVLLKSIERQRTEAEHLKVKDLPARRNSRVVISTTGVPELMDEGGIAVGDRKME